jgi:y4mF family transcriptional regulator
MTAEKIGRVVRSRRKELGMNQVDLAMTSGSGVRFISDLENGKETCQLGKTMKVLETLGLECLISARHG